MGFARRRRNQEVKAEADGVPIQSFDIECPRMESDRRRTYEKGGVAIVGPFTGFQLVMMAFILVMCFTFLTLFYRGNGIGVAPLNDDMAFD